MVTYYAAQLGIALSVVDSKANYKARIDALNSSKYAAEVHTTKSRLAIPLATCSSY